MRFFVGTYTRMGGPGVCICTLKGGKLRLLGTARDVNDPTYVILSQDDGTLFCVGSDPSSGEGMAASYRVQGDGLSLLSRQHTGGRAACHLTLDARERFLYVANYLSGSVSVLPVQEGGALCPRVQLLRHEGRSIHPTRQEGPHTHQCVFRPGTDELFVCDLGLDQIMIYRQDAQSGALLRAGAIDTPKGMGPRHLVFDGPDVFYVVGELDNRISRVALRDGAWAFERSAFPVQAGAQSALAAVRLHGGEVWASNRGHDSLYALTPDLTCQRTISARGEFPRDFAFTAGGELLIANQNAGGVVLSGGDALPITRAVCICLPHDETKEETHAV